jgi:hypothetical protein
VAASSRSSELWGRTSTESEALCVGVEDAWATGRAFWAWGRIEGMEVERISGIMKPPWAQFASVLIVGNRLLRHVSVL